MSRLSLKKITQRDLYDLFVAHLADDDLDDVIQWYILHQAVKQQRYVVFRSFVFKSNMREKILLIFMNDRFRTFARMNRSSFRYIIKLIKDDEMFQNKSSFVQTAVSAQLMFALYRLKHSENFSAFRHAIVLWEVSEDHVFDYTRRVMKALYRLRDQYIFWSNDEARLQESMKNDERENFIEVVSKIDETDVVLAYKSEDDYQDEIFFNRKKHYVLNLCAICNDQKKITYMLVEWSDSQHDARVFASIVLSQKSLNHFSLNENFFFLNI